MGMPPDFVSIREDLITCELMGVQSDCAVYYLSVDCGKGWFGCCDNISRDSKSSVLWFWNLLVLSACACFFEPSASPAG